VGWIHPHRDYTSQMKVHPVPPNRRNHFDPNGHCPPLASAGTGLLDAVFSIAEAGEL
jgi:hypothetical protein